MDALKMAQQFLEEAASAHEVSEEKDGDAYYRGLSRYKNELAVVYAAVAQAEALAKIVKLLEMMAPPLQEMIEPDAVGYHTAEEHSTALADYKYRKAQAEAWAKAERGE